MVLHVRIYLFNKDLVFVRSPMVQIYTLSGSFLIWILVEKVIVFWHLLFEFLGRLGVAPVGPTSVGVVYVVNDIVDLLTLLVEEIVILYECHIIKGYSNKSSDIEFYNIESNSNNLPRDNCCGVSARLLRIRSSSRRSDACL